MISKQAYGAIAAVIALSSPAWAQDSKTAHQTGMSIAKKRGYSNPSCYADIFAAHAAKNAQGQWKAPTGKAAVGYKNEQHAKCGISI
ncbi:MAG: hypothetical protein GY873_25915 [Bosea sp.]|uniref:hypothetical protein n=1 Tax=Bosea sp. (in: a-proteobacteria) TaxID=1871050 RepID=UPI002395A39D|nr:hypothetical protein [Bosea sp. (in: a-proteobacteria)]MCP4737633.1 hypothetical protein [Bosea sp. (in: a-proteobacteria)]